MWFIFAVFLFFIVSSGNAASSTMEETTLSEDPHCDNIRQELFEDRKKCIATFLEHLIQDNASSPAESARNCTTLDAMQDEFSTQLRRYSFCFPYDIDVIISSIQIRLEMLRNLQKNYTAIVSLKEYGSDRTDCYQKQKINIQEINMQCLREHIPKEDAKDRDLKASLYRPMPLLYYGRRSCSKSSLIVKCTIDKLKTQCPNSTADSFVQTIQNILIGDKCKNYTTDQSTLVGSPNEPPAAVGSGVITGVLIGIIALLVLGLFFTYKINNCSKLQCLQSEEYKVTYQSEPNELKTE